MIYRNLPFEEYRKGPGISNTEMGYYARSPAHYKAYKDGLLTRESRAMDLGTAVHAMILEFGRFDKEYVVGPDIHRNSNAWKEFEKDNAERKILKKEEWDKLLSIGLATSKCEVLQKLLSDSEIEISYVCEDSETGLYFRSRPDIVKGAIIADLKTTSDASQSSFARSIANYGYARQMGLAKKAVETETGGQVKACILIAIETEPPYIVQPYLCHPDMVEHGKNEAEKILKKMKESFDKDEWPGYHDGLVEIDLPGWAYKGLTHD